MQVSRRAAIKAIGGTALTAGLALTGAGAEEHQHLPDGQQKEVLAYRLYRGADGNSHVVRGKINTNKLVEVQTIKFQETSPHGSYDWHNDPTPQYVITLAGVLEFTTARGEMFTIRPGDVLLAEDNTGTGHKWRLINDEPWKRAYVIFKPGADTQFVPDAT
jgi:quercetin dioxygenase-like cupin family protein